MRAFLGRSVRLHGCCSKASTSLLALALATGCGWKMSTTCDDLNACDASAPAALGGATSVGGSTTGETGFGGAGAGGASPKGGATALGGAPSGGGTNTVGTASGGTSAAGATGGAGTGGVTSACNPACSGERPACDESAASCVQCLTNEHCAAPRPACDTAVRTCVECVTNEHCAAPRPACDAPTQSCVECLSDGHCSGLRARCKTAGASDAGADGNVCVECLEDAHCTAERPGCNPLTNACVACTRDEHCPAATPRCDVAAHACVECLSNTDCNEPGASSCSSGTCGPCASNAECAHIAGKTVCDASLAPGDEADAGTSEPESSDAGVAAGGTCVQCTGTDYAACGQSNGKSLVCDSLRRTCSSATQGSAGLCQACVSDAQCAPGELCAEQVFNGQSVGHFCFYAKGDTAHGAPALCSSARPYVQTLLTRSIDGRVLELCLLRSSTCVALNQFSSKSCTSASSTPDDTQCGTSPGLDSKCASFDTGVYRCTVTCGSDDDCKVGFTCNTGVHPNVCNLQ